MCMTFHHFNNDVFVLSSQASSFDENKSCTLEHTSNPNLFPEKMNRDKWKPVCTPLTQSSLFSSNIPGLQHIFDKEKRFPLIGELCCKVVLRQSFECHCSQDWSISSKCNRRTETRGPFTRVDSVACSLMVQRI